jgi:DNA-binding CsgD family transcriptional regulator
MIVPRELIFHAGQSCGRPLSKLPAGFGGGHILTTVPGHLVGRAEELRALRALSVAAFGDDEPAVAVVLGEPGSGKSRLLAELPLSMPDGVYLSMAGYEPEQGVDFAAAQGLITGLRAAQVDGSIGGPALDGSAATTRVEPLRVLEATHQALARLGPTLLVVDDLHWADAMSVALLHYVVRAAATAHEPLAVVVASRPSPAAVTVADSFRRVIDRRRLLELHVRPLGREDAVALARDLVPNISTERAVEVWESSGGSPFWLELLATSEHLDVDVDRIVSDRLRRSGTDEAELLATLALVARPLPVEDVAEIESWPRARVERAVATLEREGLVAFRTGAVEVIHDLIRHAAYRATPPERARRLHARIAVWLQMSAGDDERRLLEALEHQHLAGGDTTSLAVRLVDSPRRMLGVAGFARLASIADQSAPSPATSRLRAGVASLASILGQHEEALRRWGDCASSNPSPVGAAYDALRASEAALELVRGREAWLQWRKAAAHVDADPVLAVEVLAQEAMLQKFLEHRPDATQLAARRALAAAHALPRGRDDDERWRRQRALLRALHVATEASLFVGDVEQMAVHAEQLAAAASRVDDGLYIGARVSGALALRFLGLNDEAEVRLREAWVEVRRKVLPQRTLEVGLAYGNILLSMGRIGEARVVADECRDLGTRLEEFRPSRAMAVVVPHLIDMLCGDWRRSVEGLRAAAQSESDPHYRQHAHRDRATALARLDPVAAADEVRAAVRSALDDARSAACRRCLAEAVARSAEALSRIGDVADAQALLDRLVLPAADAYNGLWRLCGHAALVAAGGDHAAALASYGAVVAMARRQGLLVEAVWAELDLAVAMLPLDRVGATAVLRRAGAEAERMGFTTGRAIAEQRLRSLGVRTWRRHATTRTSAGVAELSARELEIVRLLGEGSTNPEIAATLFVSRKTVERHVSNVFAKLGVRNRAELSTLIAGRRAPSSPGG